MLADTTSSWIFMYQGEHIVSVNKANLKLTGYTEKEILHMRFWDLIHPDYQELIRKRGLARQLGEQVSNRYEVKIVCKDGEERCIDFTAGIIEWRGKPAVLGTAFDITERKRAEADVPYGKLMGMDDINPQLPNTDVVVIIGANDVVCPAAEDDPSSSIYGMPII